MNSKEIKNLLLKVSQNGPAMSFLDEGTREQIISFAQEWIETKALEEKRLADEKRKAAEREKKQKELEAKANELKHKKYISLDCLGGWAKNVPLNRRFVLAVRNRLDGEREYCAVDILRGYKSPYFGYYKYSKEYDVFVKERIMPVLSAKGEYELIRVIESEYDFFEFHEDEKIRPFAVVDYDVKPDGNVEIVGEGEMKTLAEHQADLEKEFMKND